jgi:hypothetical protein
VPARVGSEWLGGRTGVAAFGMVRHDQDSPLSP